MDKFNMFVKILNAVAFIICACASVVNFATGSIGFGILNAALAVMNLLFFFQD